MKMERRKFIGLSAATFGALAFQLAVMLVF